MADTVLKTFLCLNIEDSCIHIQYIKEINKDVGSENDGLIKRVL